MPKFSGGKTRPNVTSPMRTTGVQGTTYEGGLGFERDAKTELFLLAVTNMVKEDTFYEAASERDKRFKDLAHTVVAEDSAWVREFIPYLRNTMQMRSASIVLAAHYVHAKGEKSRQVVDSATSRADEPAEILAYWAQEYGKNFPQPLKRGVADAVERLYTERSALKYDGQSRAWRMGDVIDLVHPKPLTAEQSALYRYLLDTRHKRESTNTLDLPLIRAWQFANDIPVELRRARMLTHGIPQGMTWESLSGWLQGPMDAEAWETVIPQMGYMALLRNLRNFEDAGISKETVEYIHAKISDPDEVAKSRQFPIRFYSAWKATDSLLWSRELEYALDHSVSNVPKLEGRTLILVDVSGSMYDRMSSRSTVDRWELAAVFGAALAKANRGSSDLVAFSTDSYPIDPARSILQTVDKIRGIGGGGTDTWGAFNQHYNDHDRTIILTDEQAHPGNILRGQDRSAPIYTFNLAGYKMAHSEQGEKGSYVFGGLTDAGFVLLKAIDELQHGRWPWELDSGPERA